MTLLITGATGVVGSELLHQARERAITAVGVSRRGDERSAVAAWNIGLEAAPCSVSGPFDVVIHAAASTQWNMTYEAAHAANVAPLSALGEVVSADTRVVLISTAFAASRDGTIRSDAPEDYRNAYEWSKAAAELKAASLFGDRLSIVRPPLVVGRRTDGYVARYSGLYTLLRAHCMGLLPVVVGDANSFVDSVCVDDLAQVVLGVATDADQQPVTVTFGSGAEAPALSEVLHSMFQSLNTWRAQEGVAPLDHPKIVTKDQWERFLFPFASPHLSSRQLLSVDLLLEFARYSSLTTPLPVTLGSPDYLAAMDRLVGHWCRSFPGAALAAPRSW